MDCVWVNLKNVGPPFFKIVSVYIENAIYTAGKSFSVGHDFANERLLLYQFDV